MVSYQMLEPRNEVVHTHDTADVSGVITKEDTTKSGKGTHEIGLEGDGSFDTLRVGGRRQDNGGLDMLLVSRACGTVVSHVDS